MKDTASEQQKETTAPKQKDSNAKFQGATSHRRNASDTPVLRTLNALNGGMPASSEARAYLTTLCEGIADKTKSLLGLDIKVETIQVASDSITCYRLAIGVGYNILIGFSESYKAPMGDAATPASDAMQAVVLGLRDNDIRVKSDRIVLPTDYHLVQNAIEEIGNAYVVSANKEFNLTLAELATVGYTAETNPAKVASIISQHSATTAVQPIKLGIALFANSPERGGMPTLLIAIGGNTTFQACASSGRYAVDSGPSVISVTDAHSVYMPMATLGVYILGLAVCASHWMREGTWLSQFDTYGIHEENMGPLISDDEGLPFHIENRDQLIKFVDLKIDPIHRLVFSLNNGMPRMPEIERLVYNNAGPELERFFGMESHSMDLITCEGIDETITGVFDDGTSTENATYLSLCVSKPDCIASFAPLLRRSDNPEDRFTILAGVYGASAITPLYRKQRVFVPMDTIDVLTDICSEHINPTFTEANGFQQTSTMPGAGSDYTTSSAAFRSQRQSGRETRSSRVDLYS